MGMSFAWSVSSSGPLTIIVVAGLHFTLFENGQFSLISSYRSRLKIVWIEEDFFKRYLTNFYIYKTQSFKIWNRREIGIIKQCAVQQGPQFSMGLARMNQLALQKRSHQVINGAWDHFFWSLIMQDHPLSL